MFAVLCCTALCCSEQTMVLSAHLLQVTCLHFRQLLGACRVRCEACREHGRLQRLREPQ